MTLPANGVATDGLVKTDLPKTDLPKTEPAASGVLDSGVSLPSLGDRPTIKDAIYAALRERIVFGEIGPGDRLVETDLAARFGVSKTPVREALLTLEAEGLVTLRPHRGGVVSSLSVAEYRDLQFVRDALEFGAIDAVIAAMTEADYAVADAHLVEMDAAFRAGDYRRYRRAQRALHHRILSAPRRPTLPELAVHLNDRLDRYGRLLLDGRPERWANDLEFNRRRVELIRLGDAASLVRMVKARHEEALQLMPALLGEQGDLMDDGSADNLSPLPPSPCRGGG